MKIRKVLRNEYRDSLVLMKLSQDISAWPNVRQAVLLMGTPSNKQMLVKLGLADESVGSASPNDLIIGVELDEFVDQEAFLERLESRLRERESHHQPRHFDDLNQALNLSQGQLVSISVPGEHAAPLIRRALQADRHVFCFSDHVALDDELALKRLAVDNELLLMGPECGTAILDGVGLGFANQVRPGTIGLVAASGSGLQEVTSLIHRAGGGIAQAIGVGGRDMTSPIDGIMAEAAIHQLAALMGVDALVILAKKSSEAARLRVLEAAAQSGLPTVVDFLEKEGADAAPKNVIVADNLEACAQAALSLLGLSLPFTADAGQDPDFNEIAGRLRPTQRWLRGLFAGGSLAGEALGILRSLDFQVESNLDSPLPTPTSGHLLLDLGAEEYTRGRAHPFIDPQQRSTEIQRAWDMPETGVLLTDVVLGWGCHRDPAGALIASLHEAATKTNSAPAVIASVVGTDDDPQMRQRQCDLLVNEGVLVAPSNATAARWAGHLLREIESTRR